MNINLRPYQNEARYQVNTLLNANRSPLLVMPTGTGKTKTAIVIINDRNSLGETVYILVPQEEIFDQWVLECTKAGLNYGYINSDGVVGRNKPIYVCMPISLYNLNWLSLINCKVSKSSFRLRFRMRIHVLPCL